MNLPSIVRVGRLAAALGRGEVDAGLEDGVAVRVAVDADPGGRGVRARGGGSRDGDGDGGRDGGEGAGRRLLVDRARPVGRVLDVAGVAVGHGALDRAGRGGQPLERLRAALRARRNAGGEAVAHGARGRGEGGGRQDGGGQERGELHGAAVGPGCGLEVDWRRLGTAELAGGGKKTTRWLHAWLLYTGCHSAICS